VLDSGLHHLYFKGLSQNLDFFFLVHLYLITLNTREMMPEAKLIKSPVLRNMCVRGEGEAQQHRYLSSHPYFLYKRRKEVPCRLAQEYMLLQPGS